ncbi:MAG: LapA family protein [Acidobacteria bacterium]|nr:LapA family protein [Spirochaetota bacterium]MBE3132746.1 LapA family protein [Acidobacteriota bacterium]
MARIIITVILVVVLAVLVSMNLGFTTSVNLFGTRFDNVSVVAVAALSFAVGVVYSLLIYIGRFLHRRAKHGLASRDRDLTERERDLANRQADADRAPDAVESKTMPAAEEQTAGEPENPAGESRSGLAKFLDFFRLRP